MYWPMYLRNSSVTVVSYWCSNVTKPVMKDVESGTKEPMGLMREAEALWKPYSSTRDIVARKSIAAIESVGPCLSIV